MRKPLVTAKNKTPRLTSTTAHLDDPQNFGKTFKSFRRVKQSKMSPQKCATTVKCTIWTINIATIYSFHTNIFAPVYRSEVLHYLQVYTINLESRYLMVQGVPEIGVIT